jgi:hypothetical protein
VFELPLTRYTALMIEATPTSKHRALKRESRKRLMNSFVMLRLASSR